MMERPVLEQPRRKSAEERFTERVESVRSHIPTLQAKTLALHTGAMDGRPDLVPGGVEHPIPRRSRSESETASRIAANVTSEPPEEPRSRNRFRRFGQFLKDKLAHRPKRS